MWQSAPAHASSADMCTISVSKMSPRTRSLLVDFGGLTRRPSRAGSAGTSKRCRERRAPPPTWAFALSTVRFPAPPLLFHTVSDAQTIPASRDDSARDSGGSNGGRTRLHADRTGRRPHARTSGGPAHEDRGTREGDRRPPRSGDARTGATARVGVAEDDRGDAPRGEVIELGFAPPRREEIPKAVLNTRLGGDPVPSLAEPVGRG